MEDKSILAKKQKTAHTDTELLARKAKEAEEMEKKMARSLALSLKDRTFLIDLIIEHERVIKNQKLEVESLKEEKDNLKQVLRDWKKILKNILSPIGPTEMPNMNDAYSDSSNDGDEAPRKFERFGKRNNSWID